MKTAISMPDGLFKRVEQTARRLGLSRSRLFCLAVEQLLSKHADQEITEALNRTYSGEGGALDAQIEQMQGDALSDDQDGW